MFGRSMVIMLLLGLAPVVSSAQSLYKCMQGGNVVYQDRPCSGYGARIVTGVPISSGYSQNVTKSAAVEPKDPVARIKSTADRMERERMIGEKEYELKMEEQRIAEYTIAMEHELNQLRKKQSTASNNLAGATWLQAISQEMQAVTDRYKVHIAESRRRIEQLQAEINTLKAGLR